MPDLSAYRLVYDDEFNSFTSSPDGSSGYKSVLYFGGRSVPSNSELGYYSDSSVGYNPFNVNNGVLHITAAPGGNADGLPYNTGLITTENLFAQTYGYFEIRAQVAQGPGMWSAFYLLPADHAWPPEVDAVEAFGANNPFFGGGPNSYYHGEIAPNRGDSAGGWADVPSNIYDGFHTYGVDVEPDGITWTFDGQVLNNVGQFGTPLGFDRPMYMVAALAVGGWSGFPEGETASFNIDYIRAYSRDPSAQPVAPPAAAPGPDGSGSLTVRVSEDAWNGDAQFVVAVDGTQIGGALTATASHGAGQWQDIGLGGTFGAGPHTVAVTFINDAWNGNPQQDRNLYVQSVTIGGDTFPGAAAVNTAANGFAATDPSAAVMTVNGTATFSSSSAPPPPTASGLSIRVSEDAWNGDAQFVVTLDGTQLGGPRSATTAHGTGWQDIDFGQVAAGPHTVSVTFINDAWNGNAQQDRNLYVQSVTVNGDTIPGSAASNDAANGFGGVDPSAAVMTINGTAQFQHIA